MRRLNRFGTQENKTDYTIVDALPGDLPWYTEKKIKRVWSEHKKKKIKKSFFGHFYFLEFIFKKSPRNFRLRVTKIDPSGDEVDKLSDGLIHL